MSSLESVPRVSGIPSELGDGSSAAPSLKVPNNTITRAVAFIFKGGLIVAADSRASVGGNNLPQSLKKIRIIEITPYMLVVDNERAANPRFWGKGLRLECWLYEKEDNRRFSVRRASKFVASRTMSMETIIIGWDEIGPDLYYSDGWEMVEDEMWFCVGSGSTDANDVLANGHHYDMSIDEAVELAKRAIGDGAGSGVASVYHIGPHGWKKLSGDDVVQELRRKYPAPKTFEQLMAEVPVP